MALKIKANSLFVACSLKLDSEGVAFQETAAVGGTRRFAFRDIDCVLMSPDHTLSFQVGDEVFSIPTKPDNKKHQEVIDALVQCVRKGAIQTPGPNIA
jgi:hypothetical protein